MSDEEFTMEDLLTALEDLQIPVPAPELAHVQNMNVNLKAREIFVAGDIAPEFGDWFTCVMRYLESLSTDPIIIWLNTPGGDVGSMFTFHDLVRASTCEVITIGTGQVCSAGVLMLACGNYRLVTESTTLMSHRGEDQIIGNLEQMEAQIKVVKWSEEHWAVLMDRYTPEKCADGKLRDARYWFQLGKKSAEWWITGGAAILEEGIADAIYNAENLAKALSGEIDKESDKSDENEENS
jgi:ATP-dependent protease ClpP protease subunit